MARPLFPSSAPGVRPTSVANSAASRAALEQQLSAVANAVYDNLLDLNVSMAAVGAEWDKAIQLRSRILMMYGVSAAEARPPMSRITAPAAAAGRQTPAPMMGMMGGAAAGSFGGGASAGGDMDYKSKLNQAINKKYKMPLSKGVVEYNAEAIIGSKDYNCCLTAPTVLKDQYWNEAPAPSKRVAEQLAAKAALEAEFPEALAELGGAMFAGGMSAPGKKRKAQALGATSAPNAPNEDGKSKLMRSLQLLLGRPVMKTDIVYNAQAVESPQGTVYTCTVAFPSYNPAEMYAGEPAATTKQAQMNAAEAAVQALAAVVAPLDEERRVKKAKQSKEAINKMKMAQQQKKGFGAVGALQGFGGLGAAQVGMF